MLVGFFTACATSSPARFYTLMPANGPIATRGTLSDAGNVIMLGPVTVPAALNQPQWVVAKSEHELEVLEQHRWAAPLKDEITAALTARLSHLVRDATVAAYSQMASFDPSERILVDVSRFELRPGESVVFEALWTIKADQKTIARRGHTSLAIPVTARDHAALAAAQGRALDALAQDLAAALPTH